jgi:hypothetical protein
VSFAEMGLLLTAPSLQYEPLIGATLTNSTYISTFSSTKSAALITATATALKPQPSLLQSQFVKNGIHFSSPLAVVQLQHTLRQRQRMP